MYQFPKIDLHLHIDGSVRPITCYELAKEQGLPLGSLPFEEVESQMRDDPVDPENPFQAFDTPLMVMQTPEALARITRELLEDLEDQGVVYAELRYAPQFHLEKGLTQEDTVKAVLAGLNEAKNKGLAIEAGILLCTMEWGPGEEYREVNEETVRLAAKYLGKGVCGIDLAGYEDHLEEYAYVFDLAGKLHVPATCHAENRVDSCVLFQTPRIGHGYQAAFLPELTEYVVKQGILLEMCPKSSMVYDLPDNEDHPLRTLYLAGAKVCVNTDNMTVLNTCLEDEYRMCEEMGFTKKELLQMNLYAIEGSFARQEIKEEIVKLLRKLL